MPTTPHVQAWDDWGSVDPLFAILTEAKYRNGGGDVEEFFRGGEGVVSELLTKTDELGIGRSRGKALDFGCGVGRLTAGLSPHFEHVVGVDVAPSMIEAARQTHAGLENCEFVVNDRNDLRWVPDASLDFVLSLLVLQHLESTAAIESFLREFVRVLRPGGAIVFQLPSSVSAHEIPLPDLWTRAGLKVRTAMLLRRVGVSARFLYAHLDWVPQMTLLAVSDERVRSILEGVGGTIVHVTPSAPDAGGTVDRTFFVTK